MKKQVTILLALASTGLFAQTSKNYKRLAHEEGANYYEIVAQSRKDFAKKDMKILANKKAEKQFNRWAYYWENRVNPDGTFPSEIQEFINAGVLDKRGKIVPSASSSRNTATNDWVNVGPQQSDMNNNGYAGYPQMGRLNAFLRIPHPSDPNQDVLFVGAPNGGVWKSTDGGQNWSPKTDMLAAIGVTDIKTVPGTTTENYTSRPIYVSTGDSDGAHAKSIGVLKSTDGGETFSTTGLSPNLSEGYHMGDLVVIDANTVFVGFSKGSYNELGYIKKTTDGGSSWSNAYTGGTQIIINRVAVSGTKILFTGQWGEFYYTPDYNNDSSWEKLGSYGGYNKVAVAVGQDGTFYIQNKQGQIKKFNETTKTFSNVGNIPTDYNSQGGYNQALIVDSDRIVTGEINGQHTTDNGTTWYKSLNGYWQGDSSPGSYMHSDHHRMGRMGQHKYWSVNDGGLSYMDYSSDAQKPTINYLSGKVKVTQSYSVAINPNANDGAYVIANQDNDAMSKKSGTWYAVAMGDGIQSAINYNNPNIRYAGNQNGQVVQTNTGFEGQLNGNGNNVQIPGANFYFPLEMHKTNPAILYGGGNDVYKLDGTSGLNISSTNSGLSAVKTIATHGNAVMAATTSVVKFSSDQAGSWTTVNLPSDASGNITSVEFSATNTNVRYITYSGYTAGKKVYKTTDGGQTWTNISGNLPNIVMNEVLLYQNQSTEILYVATNLGVYTTKDGGQTWTKLGVKLPNVDVKDIELHYTGKKLVAATFGRGLWEINVSQTSLGVDDVDNTDTVLSLYPNPASSLLFVKGTGTYDYVMYNVVGGIVKRGTIASTKAINVSDLTSGVYMIRLVNAKNSVTKKVIIK